MAVIVTTPNVYLLSAKPHGHRLTQGLQFNLWPYVQAPSYMS